MNDRYDDDFDNEISEDLPIDDNQSEKEQEIGASGQGITVS